MISKLAIGAGVLAGAFVAFLVCATVTGLWLIPRAEQRGRDLERAALDAATTKAIGELTNAADKARVARRLCRERGGVYLNATGKCQQGSAE